MSNSLDKKISTKRADGEYNFPEIKEKIACPACDSGEIQLKRTIYTLPDGDEIIILNMECPECHYRRNDVIPMATAFKPGTFYLNVDDGDLDHKIFRGTSGNIDIPEIGVSIERGPAASFIINNLEGLLRTMQDQVEYFLSTTLLESVEWRNANETLKKVKQALEGRLSFQVILDDPNGGSYIIPTKPEKLRFEPIQQNNVKKG
jgi:zinc finger protein